MRPLVLQSLFMIDYVFHPLRNDIQLNTSRCISTPRFCFHGLSSVAFHYLLSKYGLRFYKTETWKMLILQTLRNITCKTHTGHIRVLRWCSGRRKQSMFCQDFHLLSFPTLQRQRERSFNEACVISWICLAWFVKFFSSLYLHDAVKPEFYEYQPSNLRLFKHCITSLWICQIKQVFSVLFLVMFKLS